MEGVTVMSGEFWGMTAFLITTIIFSITTIVYAQKLYRTQRDLRQLRGKANRDQNYHPERQNKK